MIYLYLFHGCADRAFQTTKPPSERDLELAEGGVNPLFRWNEIQYGFERYVGFESRGSSDNKKVGNEGWIPVELEFIPIKK